MSDDMILRLTYTGCLLVMLLIIWGLDRRFPVLRDLSTDPTAAVGALSYSLARVQAAFWTVLVVGSILFLQIGYWAKLGGITGPLDLNNLDTSIITLLGISGATGLVAAGVDVSKDSQVAAAKSDVVGIANSLAQTGLQTALQQASINLGAAAPAAATNIQAITSTRSQMLADLSARRSTIKRRGRDSRTKNFLSDLLTDDNGNSLHRVQIILLTLLYGAYFVTEVGAKYSLNVTFSTQALSLMGIAGGVYVGFKVPGKAA